VSVAEKPVAQLIESGEKDDQTEKPASGGHKQITRVQRTVQKKRKKKKKKH
jgi:hypothetical protein